MTVKDAGAAPGGMMRYGIPKYRLPRDILDAEVNRILDMGVTLELNTKVTDILAELNEAAGGHAGRRGGFDAAFVAVGAHIGRRAYIPAGDSARILDAVSLLRGMEMEDATPPMLGRRVAVYGGGNTAMDAARTARRLGASEAVVVYRRTRDRMPAHDVEVTEALDEGVTMRWLSTIKHADEGKLLIEKMRLDETGFPATVRPTLEAARRVTTFDEVVSGLDESTALFEARRCMSCGNCFGCDNRYGVCPDNAIVELGDGQYEIDYDYCKGCGLCVAECPCGAIEMEPEQT